MGVGDRYEVRGRIGTGTVGTVYDAFDPRIGRRVAIKVVRRPPPDDEDAEDAYARLKLEAQAAGGFSHPNVVAVYDFGEDAEAAWIVMELVEGGSLKDLLDRGSRPPVPDVGRMVVEILAALAYSHARGVVHRDVKPANLLLTPDGRVKVADFGIARIGDSTRTVVGTVIGTPAYMAPEQLRGEAADHRADIWSAGVVLYELLTGAKPFPGSPASMMHRALHTEPTAPSRLPGDARRAFDAVVARALAKRPEDRFQSAAAFAEAVRLAAASDEAAAAPVALPETPAPARVRRVPHRLPRPSVADVAPGRRSPRRLLSVALAGGGAAALAAGVGVALLLRGGSDAVAPPLDPASASPSSWASQKPPPQPVPSPPSEGPSAPSPPQQSETASQQPRQQPLSPHPTEAPPSQSPQRFEGPPPPMPDPEQSSADTFVMPTSASVRAGPTGSAPVLRSVSRGATLRVFARSGGWLQVGEEEPWGWVHESRVPDSLRPSNQTSR